MIPTLVVIAWTLNQADPFPTAILRTNELRVTVALPDPERGFYRGSRFDWSGVIGPIEFAGHKLFTPWQARHNPQHNDSIVGPVEEFGMESPLGYADAKPGGTFLKIGVGELLRPDEKPYNFYRNYPVVRSGTWSVNRGGDSTITFQHEMPTVQGYSYRYRKTVSIRDAKLLITHDFTNTGSRVIETDVYNHHFLNVDGDGIGPNYRIQLPFIAQVKNPKERFHEIVELTGSEIRFRQRLESGSIWGALTGYAPGAMPGFALIHVPSGVTLNATGTGLPLAKFHLWGVRETICPEAFQNLKVGLGERVSWNWEYQLTKRREGEPPTRNPE